MSNSGLPPNPNQWNFERNGLKLRSVLKLDPEDRLVPAEALRLYQERVFLVADDVLKNAPAKDYEVLTQDGATQWSAATVPLPDEKWAIVLNPSHPPRRRNATLMEELFHIILDHKPTDIFEDPFSKLPRREFRSSIETEAYHSAAASLVPYAGLRTLLEEGKTVSTIGQKYDVTAQLVKMRMKVCRLWRRFEHLDDA